MTNSYYKILFYIMCTMLSLFVLEKTGYAEKDEKEKGSLVDKYFKDEKNLKEDEKIADCPFCRRTIKIDNEGNITKFKEDKYQVERFIVAALQGVSVEYLNGSNAFIIGRKNTKPVYEEQYGQKKLKGYSVDSNIYLAQEYFELFKNRFEAFIEDEKKEIEDEDNPDLLDRKIHNIIDLLLKAAEERIKSIVLESRGYYAKDKAYRGEWERATAKANIADHCVTSALSKLEKYISKKKGIDEWVVKYKIKGQISKLKKSIDYSSKPKQK